MSENSPTGGILETSGTFPILLIRRIPGISLIIAAARIFCSTLTSRSPDTKIQVPPKIQESVPAPPSDILVGFERDGWHGRVGAS